MYSALFGFLSSRCNENFTSISLITTTGSVSRWPNGALIRRWQLMGQYWEESELPLYPRRWQLNTWRHWHATLVSFGHGGVWRPCGTCRRRESRTWRSAAAVASGSESSDPTPNTGAGVVWVRTGPATPGDRLHQRKGFQAEEKEARELIKVLL